MLKKGGMLIGQEAFGQEKETGRQKSASEQRTAKRSKSDEFAGI